MPLSTAFNVVPSAAALGRPRLFSSFVALGALLAASCAGEQDLEDDPQASLEWVQQSLDESDGGSPLSDGGALPSDGGGSTPLIDASFDGGISVRDGGPSLPADGGRRDGGGFTFGPIADWRFDDCSAASTSLVDSSGRGVDARRSASVRCVAGLVGQAVAFDERKDVVEAPANAGLALSSAMTVALWVKPSSGKGALINKQQGGSSVFSLSLERSRVTFSVAIRSGGRTRTVSSSAPISLNKWTHVAGVYDGAFVRLFLDGAQFGQVAAAGEIADVNAPIRIGNDASSQVATGNIDQVVMFNRPLQIFELGELACIRAAPTVVVTPASIGPVGPEVSVEYDIAITNNNVGACEGNGFFPFVEEPPAGIPVGLPDFLEIEAGQTEHFAANVTGSADAEPGTHQIPVQIIASRGESVAVELEFILAAPTGCFVRTARELLMRDLSVVEDPIRTRADGPVQDARTGVWTFGHLMEQMAPTAAAAPAMVEQVFRSWLSEQTINGFAVPTRSSMSELVLDGWPRTEGGQLDLTQSPLRLLAIVNRVDLRDLDKGRAGEGRFVFGVDGPGGFPMEFTVILEYRLPASSSEEVLAWANDWHALGQLPFPSEQYNAALEALTTRFTRRGAEPGRPNGSALGQLRTNEIALFSPWELREFKLSATTGLLEPVPVELTPDTSFMQDSSLIADYVNEHEAAILIERHDVPALYQGTALLGGSSFNDLRAWNATGINNPEARHRFSLNTCNGCHADQETGTAFLHIENREAGSVARISRFMSGMTMPDPFTGTPRTFNDLGRRNADLKALVCGGVASTLTTPLPVGARPSARPQTAGAAREQFVRRGIGRVH